MDRSMQVGSPNSRSIRNFSWPLQRGLLLSLKSRNGPMSKNENSEANTEENDPCSLLLSVAQERQGTGFEGMNIQRHQFPIGDADDDFKRRKANEEAGKSEIELSRLAPGSSPADGMMRTNGENALEVNIEFLDLSRTSCLRKKTKLLAMALDLGQLTNLKYLVLHNNMGDIGVRCFLNALESGHLRNLEKLICWQVSSYDQITTAEEGTIRIANSIKQCKMPNLKTLDLSGSLQKLEPPGNYLRDVFNSWCGTGRGSGRSRSWSGCLISCFCGRMGDCRCCIPDVLTGDDGLHFIVEALRTCPDSKNLTILYLVDNYIGDEGAKEIAVFLQEGGLPSLEELDLHGNTINREGAEAIVGAFLKNPLLTADVKMDWPDFLLHTEVDAFRECNIRLAHKLQNDLKDRVQRDQIVVGTMEQLKYYVEPASRSWWSELRSRRCRLYLYCQSCESVPTQSGEHGERPTGIKVEKTSFGVNSSKRPLVNEIDREVHITYSSRHFVENVLKDQGLSQSAGDVRTERDINWDSQTMLKELLMLAERRPDKFFRMFGLRRVLHKDANAGTNMYSAQWICDACVQEKGESVIILTENSRLFRPVNLH